MNISRKIRVVVLVLVFAASLAGAADWPQFRGPARDGLSPETGLMKEWPAGGPKEIWSVDGLGEGYASVAVADGMIYTTGMIGGEGILFAFDLDGNPKYKVAYGPEWTKSGNYPGTRTTPTVDGDRLYLMSGQGRISCHDAKTGRRIWYIDTLSRFNGENIRWGISESVLIDGEKAICTPGGKNATVVALNKMDGKTIWTTKGLSELSAYCSPLAIDRGSNRLILTMVESSIVGIDISNGTVYWRVPHKVSYDINAVTPAYENGMMYVTNAYRKGGHMFELSADGTSVERKWSEKSLDVHHGGVVLVDGNIHGASSRGEWVCLDLATGRVKFSSNDLVGKGSVIYVDDTLYGYGERRGDVGLIKIKPNGYEMVSSFRITKGSGKHWAHPVISDGRLYMRHGEVLMCYDIEQ
jgi:outer membrane protein assembly factor BamB